MARAGKSRFVALAVVLVAAAFAFGRGWKRRPHKTFPAPGAFLEGRVVTVSDGDTITIFTEGLGKRIRFHGIDCPEGKQAHGDEATAFTKRLCRYRLVKIKVWGQDRYGRILGEVILEDGRNLGDELVRAGHAWWYRWFLRTEGPSVDEKMRTQAEKRARRLQRFENEARLARRGLWSVAEPQAPWDWRRERRLERKRRARR